MEQRGLVAREQHPQDGRGAVICLTEAGRHAIEQAAPGHVEWVRTHFIDLLHGDEIDTLTAISERVIALLNDQPPRVISERVISQLNRQPPLNHPPQEASDSPE